MDEQATPACNAPKGLVNQCTLVHSAAARKLLDYGLLVQQTWGLNGAQAASYNSGFGYSAQQPATD